MIYGNGNSSKKIVKYLEKIQITDKMLQKKIMGILKYENFGIIFRHWVNREYFQKMAI